MEVIEIALSKHQTVRESCWSGYVEFKRETDDDHVIVVDVDTGVPFEGDGTLEVVLWTDVDECLIGAEEVCRSQPLTADDCVELGAIGFSLAGLRLDPIIALQYVVKGKGFVSGEVTARLALRKDAWFDEGAHWIECRDKRLSYGI